MGNLSIRQVLIFIKSLGREKLRFPAILNSALAQKGKQLVLFDFGKEEVSQRLAVKGKEGKNFYKGKICMASK